MSLLDIFNSDWLVRNTYMDPLGHFVQKKLSQRLHKDPTIPESRYNGIEVQKSIYGDPVPLIYGQQRIAITLGWYANFKATPHTDPTTGGGKGGGGQAQQATLTYSASLIGLLCEGQIAGIGAVWSDKTITTTAALGFTVFNGASGQAVWSFLTTNFPSQAIPYADTAYVAAGAFDLKDSAAMPNLSLEVKALLQFGSGIVDSDPSAVLTDYCTNAGHGCNFTGLGSLTNYQNYCIAMGFFLSPFETSQRPAVDFIRELLDTTNSDCWVSAGVLNILPLADAAVTGNSHTYTPNLTPVFSFTDDDYIYEEGDDPVKVTRKATSDTYNVVRIEYLDRSNNYNTAIAEASDAQDIALNGMRVAPTRSLHMITTLSVARQVAQIILQRNLYYRNSFQFKVRADYCLLEPMDIVSFSDSGLGITNQLGRISEVQDDEEDQILLTVDELPLGPASAPLYNWQAAQGYAANFGIAPGSVQTPAIVMAPPLLLGSDGGYEIWIAVSGPSASANWGGCRVLMSLDNTRYKTVGSIYGPARYGTLTASLATGADPDTTHTLSIKLNNTALTMQAGNTADADNMRTIILVENEIMSYRDATLTGAGAYNLGYLRRGKYGTAIAAHSSAVRFVRLDGAIFRMPFDPGMIGQTIWFKFQSFNIYQGGLEDPASLAAYSYVPTNPNAAAPFDGGLTLVPRGDCVAVGTSIYKKTTATAAWDSDCYSAQSYANGCALSWQFNQINLAIMVGLNTDPATDSNYTSIDFAWYAFDATPGNFYIYESGTQVAGPFSSYTTDSVFSVVYDGRYVRYLKDGVVFRQVYKPDQTFFMDSSFFQPGGAVRNIAFNASGAATPAPFLARGNCVVSDDNVQKIGGINGWDSDCYSINGYQNCHVVFKANNPAHAVHVGLNTDPLFDQSFTSIDFSWYARDTGGAEIYESGSLIAAFGAYTTATVFAITYDGATVRYYLDGVNVRSVSIASQTFFMDSSFYYPTSGINSLRFGPTTNLAVTDTPQIGNNAATEISSATDAGPISVTTVLGGGNVSAWIKKVTLTAQFNCDIELKCVALLDTNTSLTNALVFARVEQLSSPFTVQSKQQTVNTTTAAGTGIKIPVAININASLLAGVSYDCGLYLSTVDGAGVSNTNTARDIYISAVVVKK